MQKVVNVYAVPGEYSVTEKGLKELNELLEQGWRVLTVSPMGGAAYAKRGSGSSYQSSESKMVFASTYVLTDEVENNTFNM